MPHIVVACTANICRSPYVEAFLRRELAAHPDDYSWAVSSAGTWAPVERGAARYSIKLAKDRGMDISGHRSRMVSNRIMNLADLVICMTTSHREALTIDFRNNAHKVFLMSEMIGKDFNVVDPYGGPYDGYVDMVQLVERLIIDGLPRIKQLSIRNATTRV